MRNIFFILFFFIGFQLFAQSHSTKAGKGTSKVLGVVIDKVSGKAVEYATVSVLKDADSSIIAGMITDETGHFVFSALPVGRFRLKVQFIGYKPFKSKSFDLGAVYDAGTIYLEEENTRLSEVVVSGQRPEIETRIDKKIISVDPSLASSGTAIDVLQRVPSVSVDQDGNVSMRGSSNVTILMDGRQSAYTSLDQIPASLIDRVEVVTNPSARYDASGMGGIINIITKKNTRRGLNGVLQFNAGTSQRYNGNVALSYGVKKWSFFLNADGRQMRALLKSDTKYNWFNGNNSYQFSNDEREGRMGGIKFGVDFRPNDSNTISLSSHLRAGNFESVGNGAKYSQVLGVFDTIPIASSSGSSIRQANAGLEYKRILSGKDHELVVGGNGSLDKPISWSNTASKSLTETETDVQSRSFELRSDYTHPISESSLVSLGGKLTYSNGTTDSKQILSGINRDSTTVQNFGVGAAYLILSHNIRKIKLQAGVRVEKTQQEFLSHDVQIWSRSYFDYFPSGGIVFSLSDLQNIQLNYSRRINRPTSPRLMMAVIDRSDPENLSQGNPLLNPEYINSLELSYTYSKQIFSFTSTLFYRQTVGTITRVVQEYEFDKTKTMSSFINGSSLSSFGLEQTLLMPLGRKLRSNTSFSLFGLQVRDTVVEQRFGSPFLTGMIKCNVIYTPFKSLDFAVNFRYNAPSISMQGNADGRPWQGSGAAGLIARTWQVDLSAKKEFLQGKLATTIRIQDLFNTDSAFKLHSYSVDYESFVAKNRTSRVLYLGLTYKLNEGMKQNKKRQQEQQSQDEF